MTDLPDDRLHEITHDIACGDNLDAAGAISRLLSSSAMHRPRGHCMTLSEGGVCER